MAIYLLTTTGPHICITSLYMSQAASLLNQPYGAAFFTSIPPPARLLTIHRNIIHKADLANDMHYMNSHPMA